VEHLNECYGAIASEPAVVIPASNKVMVNQTEAPVRKGTLRKATVADLEVGLICADRDGNRIRIDRVDPIASTLSYHFLNDELRVQEGIQEGSIANFIAEGWYIATNASL
jgi:hypothetical protein